MGRELMRWVCALVLVGCTGSDPVAAPTSASARGQHDPAATKGVVAAPEVVADADPRDEPARESDELVLHAVARGHVPLRLFRTSDDLLFVAAGVQAIRIPGRGPLARESKFLAGIEDPGALARATWAATAIGGRLPDTMTMVVESVSDRRAARHGVYRFAGDTWQRVANVQGKVAWTYDGFTPWRHETALTRRVVLARDGSRTPIAADRFEILGGDGLSAPRFDAHAITAFASMKTGHVVAVAGTDSLLWTPDSDVARIVPLGLAVVAPVRLTMAAPDDVWLHHGAGLLHFDGTSWSKSDTPREGGVSSLSVSAEGAVWIVLGADGADDNALFRRTDGAWTQIDLPRLQFPLVARPTISMAEPDPDEDVPDPARQHTLVPMQVLTDGNNLWVTARGDEHRWALLHDRYRGAPLELPDAETMRREALDLAPDRPFTGRESCEVFVPITVDDVTADHDELRAELDEIGMTHGGMLLLEVVRDGAPAIGVAIPGAQPLRAKAIVAAMRRSLGSRMGPPICQPMIATRLIELWSGA